MALIESGFDESPANVHQLQEESSRQTVSYSGPQPASILARGAARMIDILLSYILSIAAASLAVTFFIVMSAAGNADSWLNLMNKITLPTMLFYFAGSVTYHAITEFFGGASIGKLLLQLRVIRSDQKPLSLLNTLIRNAAICIDGLFFGLIGILNMSGSPAGQRLGDRWGKTVVIKSKDVPTAQKTESGSVVLGIFVGLMFWLAFDTASFILAVY